MNARTAEPFPPVCRQRVNDTDWAAVTLEMSAVGCALTPPLLTSTDAAFRWLPPSCAIRRSLQRTDAKGTLCSTLWHRKPGAGRQSNKPLPREYSTSCRVVNYERLVMDWEIQPEAAIRGITWVVELVAEAIRDGRRPVRTLTR
jgi:hypothetical protein